MLAAPCPLMPHNQLLAQPLALHGSKPRIQRVLSHLLRSALPHNSHSRVLPVEQLHLLRGKAEQHGSRQQEAQNNRHHRIARGRKTERVCPEKTPGTPAQCE